MEFIGCLILLVFLVMIVGFIANNFIIISLTFFSLLIFFLAYRSSKKNSNNASNNNTTFEQMNEKPESYEEKYKMKPELIFSENADFEDETFTGTTIEPAPEDFKKYTRVRKEESNYTVLDFETTGLSSIEDEIIEVGAIKFVDDVQVDSFHSYIYPQRNNISERITSITGIDMDTVISSPTIDEILPDLVDFLNNENIVAHNASFDMKFLLQNMYNEGFEYQRFRVIDTLSLARRELPFLKNHKLQTIKEFLKIDVDSHNAQNDCLVTAALYQHIKNNQA